MVELRASLDPIRKSTYDQLVCKALLDLILRNKYKVVHSYLPMPGEIDTLPLLRELLQLQVEVICPKTLRARRLKHLKLIEIEQVEKGLYGTTHPRSPHIYQGAFDLIIVPGLAFDKEGYRLGYGGGYYDAFLSEHRSALQYGIAYPFQVLENVPREGHDVKMDKTLYFSAL